NCRRCVAGAVDDLPVRGVVLGLVAFLHGLGVGPRPCLQSSVEVREAALLQILRTELGELSIALVPRDDVVIVGELAPLAALILPVPIRCDGDIAYGCPAGRVPQLRVARQAPDQHHTIEGTSHHLSPSSSLAEGASSSSSSGTSSSV